MRGPLVVVFLASAVALGAQDAGEPLAFEVASVRANTTSDGVSIWTMPPGRFVATNMTVRSYVFNAYELSPFQVEGGPPWVDSLTFDISAVTGDDVSDGQRMLMLRTLLAERFKLVTHVETREQQAFSLVVADEGGELGAGLMRTLDDCEAIRRARRALAAGGGEVDRPSCGENVLGRTGSRAMTLTAGGLTMAELARILVRYAGRPVLDRTGLSGRFDLDLRFAPTRPLVYASTPDDAPTIFTALEEQLGLRLEAGRGPVEYLVIDSVEQPEPN